MCGNRRPRRGNGAIRCQTTSAHSEGPRHRPGDLGHQGGRLRRGRRDPDVRGGCSDAASGPGRRGRTGPRAVVGLGAARPGGEAIARAGRGVDAVGFANQGETVLAWDRATGRPLSTAISWQDRRAAAVCTELADDAEWLTRTTGLPLDPYFAAPKMTWLRRNVTDRGRGDDERRLVAAPPHRCLRHRRHDRLPDAAARPGSAVPGPTRPAPHSASTPRTCPTSSACAEEIGRTDAFGPSLPVTGSERRPTGRPGRASTAWSPGSRSAPTEQVPSSWPTPARGPSPPSAAWPSRWPGNSARRPHTALTARSMPPAPPSPGCSAGVSSAAPRTLDTVAGSVPDSGSITVVPALSGLGAPWWRPDALASIDGIGPGTRARPCRPGHLRGPGGAGDAAGPRRGARPGSTTGAPAGRRRADPLPRAHADAGRPAAGPRRGCRLAARHRGRRGRAGPARGRIRPDARGRRPTGRLVRTLRAGHRRRRSSRSVWRASSAPWPASDVRPPET